MVPNRAKHHNLLDDCQDQGINKIMLLVTIYSIRFREPDITSDLPEPEATSVR